MVSLSPITRSTNKDIFMYTKIRDIKFFPKYLTPFNVLSLFNFSKMSNLRLKKRKTTFLCHIIDSKNLFSIN